MQHHFVLPKKVTMKQVLQYTRRGLTQVLKKEGNFGPGMSPTLEWTEVSLN